MKFIWHQIKPNALIRYLINANITIRQRVLFIIVVIEVTSVNIERGGG